MLSKWETLFILVMTIPIIGHVVILPIMLDVAGRDAWISILLSLPGAFLFAIAIYKVRKKYPDSGPVELFTLVLGKKGGKVLIGLLVAYFLFLSSLSYATLIDVVFIDFLPETPRLALILWFSIFMVYAALKGVKRIALTAGVLAILSAFAGHTVTLMDANKKEWGQLLPILEFGWSPVLWGTLIITSIWIELLVLLCVPIRNMKEKGMFLLWGIGILLNGLMMASTTTGVITIFGLGQADNFLYPAQEIVRVINLGFIDRFDIYGMVLMTFGVYIRSSLYLRIAYELGTSRSSSKWFKKILFISFILLIVSSVIYITNIHFRLETAINLYAYMIVLYPIPFVLWFVAWVRNRKKVS